MPLEDRRLFEVMEKQIMETQDKFYLRQARLVDRRDYWFET